MKKRLPSFLTEDDRQIFREAVKKVTPLKKNGIPPVPVKQASLPVFLQQTAKSLPYPKKQQEFLYEHHKYGDTIHYDGENERDLNLSIEKINYFVDEVSTHLDAKLFFRREGVQDKLMKQLRQGKLTPQAFLDLHGKTRFDAMSALESFLKTCLARHLRVVHLIHGKGRNLSNQSGILKRAVDLWLRECHFVLGFCSCPPYNGGTGAVYVLLKK